jgi:hypothetical protein
MRSNETLYDKSHSKRKKQPIRKVGKSRLGRALQPITKHKAWRAVTQQKTPICRAE